MITINPVLLRKADGTTEWIDIEPISYEDEGQTLLSGVYSLTARPGEPDLTVDDNDPIKVISAGEIAFHQDNVYEWEYIGNHLDDEEQHEIARVIQTYGQATRQDAN